MGDIRDGQEHGTEHFLGSGKLGIDRLDLVGNRAHILNESGRILFFRFHYGNVG